MHLANQSSRKLDKLSQGAQSRQAIPEFNGGNTLDKREATDPRGNENNPVSSNQSK